MRITAFKAYGVIFLVLALAAWLLGAGVTMRASRAWGIANVAAILVGFVTVVWSYCAKCPVRKDCSHVLPGFLTRFFPRRTTGPYSRADVAAMAVAFILMTVFPLYWLVRNLPLLVLYVALLAAAVVELRAKVCGDCRNVFCVLRKNPAGNVPR